MRKLGHGQSVMFFAPLEVDRGIRRNAGKGPSEVVEVLDILRWAMLGTCADIQHHVPQWAQQGVDYERRNKAWVAYSSQDLSVADLRSSWLQAEALGLEAMYGASPIENPVHAAFAFPGIRDRCAKLGILSFTESDTRMEEEQEREVSHEIERELNIERPPKAQPATHSVHPDVIRFVRTGVIPPQSCQFVSPFSSLRHYGGTFCENWRWTPNLLATNDFSTTIQGSAQHANDYLRPVNWILSSPRNGHTCLVVLSPFEVNSLLPRIRQSKAVHLHQYIPRVTHTMKSFDHLEFYCIPSLPRSWAPPAVDLRNQLNLWAGQLYLEDHETYLRLCNFIGLYSSETPRDTVVQSDGFIKPEDRQRGLQPPCQFTESPVPFLRELIGLRRKGMSYSSTHVGKILHARNLTHDDFN
jgi:hypothetical protein